MKKMNNKGFSMVELIIVIAIMAILAGAIAPTLIKYVNKSRMSSDVTNAQTIAHAVQSALANPTANNAAPTTTTPVALSTLTDTNTDDFEVELSSILGSALPKVKYTKDGATDFYVEIDTANNVVKVYVNATSGNVELYPDTNSNYQ